MKAVIRAKDYEQSRKDYQAASRSSAKKQWVCIMNRNPIVDNEFGIEIAYCVDVIGIHAALEKAQVYLERAKFVHSSLEYKIEGREW